MASLSERLRSETWALHTQVERSGIMPAFLRGQIERSRYCTMLRNLHEIYLALETTPSACTGVSAISAILRPELTRAPALCDDLRHLHGADWNRALYLSPAAVAYAAHLRQLAMTRPQLLLAHAYVRYLGDLSGGQILQGIVSRALRLHDGHGTRFYQFPEPPGPAALARDFRAALDAIEIDDDGTDAIIAEAKSAFVRHAELFRELAG